MEMEPIYWTALQLVAPLWRGLDPDYKGKYRRTIWGQFENQIRSAAYTTTLSLWYSRICARLPIDLREADGAAVQAIVLGGEDRTLLRLLRDEAPTLVTMLRVENEARRAAQENGPQ
jgi:hypothetical protein